MSKLSEALSIAALAGVAMAGAYAFATTIAGDRFITAESTPHAPSDKTPPAVTQAAAEHIAERAKCAFVVDAETCLCGDEARTVRSRTGPPVRAGHRDAIRARTLADTELPRKIREVDLALYQAHRQLPDWQPVLSAIRAPAHRPSDH